MAEGPEAYVARVYVQLSAAIYIGVDKRRQEKRKAEEINTVEVNANELAPRERTKNQRETNETRGRRKGTK